MIETDSIIGRFNLFKKEKRTTKFANNTRMFQFFSVVDDMLITSEIKDSE